MALEIGSRLGHYDVTALIGEGGVARCIGRPTSAGTDDGRSVPTDPDLTLGTPQVFFEGLESMTPRWSIKES